MQNRLAFRSVGLVFVMATSFFVASERPSPARPFYKKCFDKVYKDTLKDNKTSCNICHAGDDKKKLNHYGQAIAKELGEKNVRDEEKVIAAIKAVAKKKCKTGDWGERLEKGLAPCDCKDNDTGSYVVQQLQRSEQR